MADQVSIHRLTRAPKKEDLLASRARLDIAPRPTPENPLIISASELRDWLRCRVMHNWRHQCRLEPVGGKTALALGSLVHEGKDRWYQLPAAKRTVKAMTKVATALTSVKPTEVLETKDLELAKAMLIGYADFAKTNDPVIGLVDCYPEEWFDLPLVKDGRIRVRGKIDNRFKPTTLKKTMAFLESKTAGQFKHDIIETNLQLSVYFWALRQRFPKIKRFIGHFQQLRKQMPGPRVTAPLFMREPVERGNDEIDQWAIDTEHAALEMLDGAIFPNPMDSCSWSCDFKIPCLLRGNKADLLHVLRTEYQTKEKRK